MLGASLVSLGLRFMASPQRVSFMLFTFRITPSRRLEKYFSRDNPFNGLIDSI